MSIEDINKVDMIGIPKNNQDVVNLAITDHRSWNDSIEDHLLKLLNEHISADVCLWYLERRRLGIKIFGKNEIY